jgi:hypothetical protein
MGAGKACAGNHQVLERGGGVQRPQVGHNQVHLQRGMENLHVGNNHVLLPRETQKHQVGSPHVLERGAMTYYSPWHLHV